MGKDNSAEEKDARVEQILVEVGYFCIHVHLKFESSILIFRLGSYQILGSLINIEL